MVFGPLERVLHRMEMDGTVEAAGRQVVFKEDGKGGWYDLVAALRGVIQFHELAESRYGLSVDLQPLVKFANKLDCGTPLFESDLAAVRASMAACAAQAMKLRLSQADRHCGYRPNQHGIRQDQREGRMSLPSPQTITSNQGGLVQDLFITVPETTLPGGIVVPSFQVGQYACTQGEDGKAAVTAEGTPWTRINFEEARIACEKAGYQRITERQWKAIVLDAAAEPCNWTKGEVGAGKLFRGIRKGNVTSAQPGTYEPESRKERRWLTLSNGERICDMNGNLFQWVVDDVQGDEAGLIAKPFAEDSLSLLAPYPSLEKGMGWRPNAGANWSGNALVRGGYWDSGSYAGAFYLGLGWPDYRRDNVGFRCTRPLGL